MVYRDDSRALTWQPDRLYAAVFTAITLGVVYLRYHGADAVDWQGYSEIYDRDGAWLARQGRDPLFVALVGAAKVVFGGNGYAAFRASVFGVFVAVAAFVAYAMRPGRPWAIFVAVVVVAAFLIKSQTQIREGLAFVLVLGPLIRTYRLGAANPLMAGTFALAAYFMHSGAVVFLALWVMAATFSLMPRLVVWRGLPWFLLALGVCGGLAGAALASASAGALEFSLQDLGIDTSVQAIGGAAKNVYWLVNGLVVLVIWRQLLVAGHGCGWFGRSFAICLGSFVLPFLYTVCLALVFRQFYLPAVTSMAVRLLLSSMQLGLLIVGLRGALNLWSIGIASASILDQARLLFQGSFV
jgi:hypothetical protein